MSRMVEALKALDGRRHSGIERTAELIRPREAAPRIESPHEASLAEVERSLEAALATETSWAPAASLATPIAPFETCSLPTTTVVPDHYFDLASKISEQVAASYCAVLHFVSPEGPSSLSFSITQLAQAFAFQSSGDVLLVDGDLREGRLSKSVCPTGPGMTEAMLGTSNWLDLIHPTNLARIDFVSRGHNPVPTLERSEFGWGALRPKYRTVLIGLSGAEEPETNWLASRCDGVYLVLSRPRTRRRAASAAISNLRASGASVLGCVVEDN